MPKIRSLRPLLTASSLLFLAACQDLPTTMPTSTPTESVAPASPQGLSAGFDRASPEVMALPQTVFAARDRDAGQLVFGVEHEGVEPAVRNVMERLGIPASDYRIEVTEPIRFLNETLRTQHRPTVGGIQIHFSNYLCTLGFNVDHAEGRSFITNSHCTDKQGEDSGTIYYQPTSNADSSPIGVEADDPAYVKALPGSDCSFNKRCRYSDAARVQYEAGIESLGEIAKTTGLNSQSLNVSGSFDITSQSAETEFAPESTLYKVGRTTGWTSGSVGDTCATVNVFGSNIQLLCQTFVHNSETTIAGSGDSGSPVFRDTGNDTAELVGILWGGSGTSTFVFSPFKNIQDELGTLDATADGTSEPPVVEDPGSITGTVTDAGDNTAIQGASVTVVGTNLTATTDDFGNYAIADVPVGTYDVTASKEGYVSQTATGVEVTSGTSTTVNFQLAAEEETPPAPTDGTVSVADITYSTHGGRAGDRHLTVTVSLVDGDGSPVADAGVGIELSRNGSLYGTAAGTTGSDGAVSFGFNNAPSGTYTTLVTGVSASGLTWDGVTPENSFEK